MRNDIDAAASQLPTDPALAGVPGSRKPANAMRLGAAVLALGMASALVIQGSRAAFSDTTTSGSNSVAAGTVVLNHDDGATKMFDISNLNGGQNVTRCINVDYTGSLNSDIKLYGAVGGTGLAPGLDVVITVGTGATGGTSNECTGFVADGPAAFTGTLAAFGTSHTNFGNGVGGNSNAAPSSSKSYRISMTVVDDNAYQGTNASVSFTWEAQGLNS